MADPTAVLGLLWTVATGIYERIGKHRIGHTDLQFQLARYKAYTTVEEKAKLDQGLRHLSCHSTAERLYQLHAAVGKWLASNHFKVKPSGRIDNPHLFPDVRAASFTNIVNTIAQERNELVQELETHAAPVLLFADLQPVGNRPRLIHPNTVTRISQEITTISAQLGVAATSPNYPIN